MAKIIDKIIMNMENHFNLNFPVVIFFLKTNTEKYAAITPKKYAGII